MGGLAYHVLNRAETAEELEALRRSVVPGGTVRGRPVADTDSVEAGLGLHATGTRAPEENEGDGCQLKTPDPFFLSS